MDRRNDPNADNVGTNRMPRSLRVALAVCHLACTSHLQEYPNITPLHALFPLIAKANLILSSLGPQRSDFARRQAQKAGAEIQLRDGISPPKKSNVSVASRGEVQ